MEIFKLDDCRNLLARSIFDEKLKYSAAEKILERTYSKLPNLGVQETYEVLQFVKNIIYSFFSPAYAKDESNRELLLRFTLLYGRISLLLCRYNDECEDICIDLARNLILMTETWLDGTLTVITCLPITRVALESFIITIFGNIGDNYTDSLIYSMEVRLLCLCKIVYLIQRNITCKHHSIEQKFQRQKAKSFMKKLLCRQLSSESIEFWNSNVSGVILPSSCTYTTAIHLKWQPKRVLRELNAHLKCYKEASSIKSKIWLENAKKDTLKCDRDQQILMHLPWLGKAELENNIPSIGQKDLTTTVLTTIRENIQSNCEDFCDRQSDIIQESQPTSKKRKFQREDVTAKDSEDSVEFSNDPSDHLPKHHMHFKKAETPRTPFGIASEFNVKQRVQKYSPCVGLIFQNCKAPTSDLNRKMEDLVCVHNNNYTLKEFCPGGTVSTTQNSSWENLKDGKEYKVDSDVVVCEEGINSGLRSDVNVATGDISHGVSSDAFVALGGTNHGPSSEVLVSMADINQGSSPEVIVVMDSTNHGSGSEGIVSMEDNNQGSSPEVIVAMDSTNHGSGSEGIVSIEDTKHGSSSEGIVGMEDTKHGPSSEVIFAMEDTNQGSSPEVIVAMDSTNHGSGSEVIAAIEGTKHGPSSEVIVAMEDTTHHLNSGVDVAMEDTNHGPSSDVKDAKHGSSSDMIVAMASTNHGSGSEVIVAIEDTKHGPSSEVIVAMEDINQGPSSEVIVAVEAANHEPRPDTNLVMGTNYDSSSNGNVATEDTILFSSPKILGPSRVTRNRTQIIVSAEKLVLTNYKKTLSKQCHIDDNSDNVNTSKEDSVKPSQKKLLISAMSGKSQGLNLMEMKETANVIDKFEKNILRVQKPSTRQNNNDNSDKASKVQGSTKYKPVLQGTHVRVTRNTAKCKINFDKSVEIERMQRKSIDQSKCVVDMEQLVETSSDKPSASDRICSTEATMRVTRSALRASNLKGNLTKKEAELINQALTGVKTGKSEGRSTLEVNKSPVSMAKIGPNEIGGFMCNSYITINDDMQKINIGSAGDPSLNICGMKKDEESKTKTSVTFTSGSKSKTNQNNKKISSILSNQSTRRGSWYNLRSKPDK